LIGEKDDTGGVLVGVECEVMEDLCSEDLLGGVTPAAFLASLSFSRSLKLTPWAFRIWLLREALAFFNETRRAVRSASV
jgi:hypothetical protein